MICDDFHRVLKIIITTKKCDQLWWFIVVFNLLLELLSQLKNRSLGPERFLTKYTYYTSYNFFV